MVRIYLAELGEGSGTDGQKPGRSYERQSAAAHRLLQKALEQEFPERAGSFLTEKDERGKPRIRGCEEIHISISHSGILAACAVADRPVGVDLEERRERSGRTRILRRFHPREKEWLKTAARQEQEKAFYDLWVRKESFLKAVGEGLRLRLDSFCTVEEELEEGRSLYSGLADKVAQEFRPETYYVRQYLIEGHDYSLAACSEETAFAGKPVWICLEGEF